MPRTSFQHGSVIRVRQKSGDVWRLRYRDGAAQRSEYLGSIRELPTKAAAEKAAASMLALINGPRSECILVSDLIARFEKEAMPTRAATAHSYKSILKRIGADWGESRIDQFVANIMAVQNWLDGLTVIGRHPKPGKPKLVSSMYRGQVRNVLHNLFEKAMLWQVVAIDRNPISLLKVKDASKRASEPVVLSPEQQQQLVEDEDLPLLMQTMVYVASALGLRVSEVLGLKWSDIDYEAGEVKIRGTKTASSAAKLPLHAEVVAVLQTWRMTEPVVNGWVFGSPRTGKPYTRDHLRETYLKPAGAKLGLPNIGFHDLRHSYRAHLRESNVPIETQKNLLRHSRISTTMDVYGGSANVEELRPANAKVVEILKRRVS